MMLPDEVRLRHMLDSAREAVEFLAGRSRRDLDTDRMLLLSVVKSIEIVGEASTKVSAATRQAHPHLPWKEMAGMRNRLVHGYYDINRDVVWETVTDELPPLMSQLASILDDLGDDG